MNEQRILRAAKAHGAVKLSPEFIQARNAINQARVIIGQTGQVTLGQLSKLKDAIKPIPYEDKHYLLRYIQRSTNFYVDYARMKPSGVERRNGSILLSVHDSDRIHNYLNELIKAINAKRDSI